MYLHNVVKYIIKFVKGQKIAECNYLKKSSKQIVFLYFLACIYSHIMSVLHVIHSGYTSFANQDTIIHPGRNAIIILRRFIY